MDKLKYIKLENEDGSYSSSIPLSVSGEYVDINLTNDTSIDLDTYVNTNNTNINNLTTSIAGINNQIDEHTTAIQGLASGSPKGVYESVTALTNANPDTGVYIVTLNGHAYSWVKNGSSATDLGLYQSSGIADESITTPALNKNVVHNILNGCTAINNKINKSYNINLTMDDIEDHKYLNDSGNVTAVGHTQNILTKMMAIPNNVDFRVTLDFNNHTSMRFCAYDENYNFLFKYSVAPSVNPFPGNNVITSIVPYNARYFRFQITNTSEEYGDYAPYLPKIHISISQYASNYDFTYKKNLVDNQRCVAGFIENRWTLGNLSNFKTSPPIFVKPGILYFSNMRAYSLATASGTYTYNNESGLESYDNRYVTITEDSTIIFSYYKEKNDSIMMCYVNNTNEIPEYEPCRLVPNTPLYLDGIVYPEEVDNSVSLNGVYKREQTTNWYWTLDVDHGGNLIKNPTDFSFSTYYCPKILCNSNQKIMYKGKSTTNYVGVVFFDDRYKPIGSYYGESLDSYTEVDIPEKTKYALIQGNASYAFDFYITESAPLIHVNRNTTKAYDYDSILTNKKWYVCGDSFTHGDFTGAASTNEYIFSSGIYAGQYKVYAYYIGNRTNVDVTMLARNGMTLASVSGRNNCFAEGTYLTIPENADYVTLYFGINDILQNVPVGTDDSTDVTTFKGAWNVVLTWLRNNRPFTHVGIVVTNKSGSGHAAYFEAIRTMAKKYGYPILDLEKDTQIPLVSNCYEREGIDPTIQTLVNNQFKVGNNNGHPNAQAHELMSNIIENFLHEI